MNQLFAQIRGTENARHFTLLEKDFKTGVCYQSLLFGSIVNSLLNDIDNVSEE